MNSTQSVDDTRQRLRRSLTELRLPSIRAEHEEMAQAAEQNSWSYEEFLCELIEIEVEARRQRRIERHMKDSRLPPGKTLEVLDRSCLPLPLQQQLRTILEGSFLSRKENLLVFGRPGSGKTHLVCAIGYEMIRKGYRVGFYSCNLLVQDLLLARRELRLPAKLKRLRRYDILIIDDIGYIQQTRDEMEVLFSLLADWYEQGSVMVTSNLPFSKWDQVFKDKMLAAAAIDRLIHHSIILELNVESYRAKAAKQRHDENNKNAE